jgi:hypothetical protein
MRGKTRDGQDISFGPGWVVDGRNASKEAWHLGGGRRMKALFCMRPEQEDAVSEATTRASPAERLPSSPRRVFVQGQQARTLRAGALLGDWRLRL